MTMTVKELIGEFLAIREDLDKARHNWKQLEAELKARQDEIEMALREKADELGVDSLGCEFGTAYRTTKESFRVGNWDSILDYIQRTNNWQMLEKRIAKLATKEIYETTKELPPGVEYVSEVEFVVRKS